jgi:hypothetical protein
MREMMTALMKAPPMPRPAPLPLAACLLLALLVAGCAAPADPARNERATITEACRNEATRVVQWRDRGQLMRTDETESGLGTQTIAPYDRVAWDRYVQQTTRDRMTAECVRGATTTPVVPTNAAPARPSGTNLALPPPGVTPARAR